MGIGLAIAATVCVTLPLGALRIALSLRAVGASRFLRAGGHESF
jgi:hypothetical protein